MMISYNKNQASNSFFRFSDYISMITKGKNASIKNTLTGKKSRLGQHLQLFFSAASFTIMKSAFWSISRPTRPIFWRIFHKDVSAPRIIF